MFSKRIPWKLLGPFLIVMAAAPLAITLGRRALTAHIVRAAGDVPAQAFTLELVDVLRKDSDRTTPGLDGLRQIVAQRGDGARVQQITYNPGKSMEFTERMIDMPDGTNIVASDSVGLRTTWKGSLRKANLFKALRSRTRTPESGCATDASGKAVADRAHYVSKGLQVFQPLGMQTIVFTRSDPAEYLQLAPQLDCELVYRFTVFKKNDGSTDSSERIAKSYTLGNPAVSLFEVSTLKEASPISSFTAQYRKIGWPEDKLQQRISEMKDQENRYHQQ